MRRAMDVLDGKWTLLVIRELLSGTKRFGELLGAIGGVSARVLTQRLQLLENQGVIRRVSIMSGPGSMPATMVWRPWACPPFRRR